jgi:hypothetical protein
MAVFSNAMAGGGGGIIKAPPVPTSGGVIMDGNGSGVIKQTPQPPTKKA